MRWLTVLLVMLAPSLVRAETSRDVLTEKGCVACHSIDGAPSPGPTFAGLAGKTTRVQVGGAVQEKTADRDYLRRSIAEPEAEVVVGYSPGMMPRLALTPEEQDRAVDQIEALASVKPKPPPSALELWPLLLSSLAFVGFHLALSSGAVRPRMIKVFGELGFQGVYSLLVGAGLGGMAYFFRRVPYLELWSWAWARWLPIVGMPLVMYLWVAGYTTKNPTSAGQNSAVRVEPSGIVRISRHPANVGFVIWGLLHIPPNGDVRSLIVFVSLLVLAVAGTLHIDRRRAETEGEAWQAFARKTSVIPFLAILQGRNTLSLRELGWARPLVAIVLYVGMLHGHRAMIGVPVLP